MIAVSQDIGAACVGRGVPESHKIATLGAYQDPKMALSGALGPDTVLPTSILYRRQWQGSLALRRRPRLDQPGGG